MIQYIENTNLAYCDGYKFRKDKKSGYWLCTILGKRLHVYIYEKYNGTIPKGMQVHHIDMNKDNNEIDNLKLLTKSEHTKLHYNMLSDEEKEKRKQIVKEKSIPKLIEYNKKNPKPKEWYKKHYEEMKDKLYVIKDFKCLQCGKDFKSVQSNSKFCSNACKSKWRRVNHIDDEERSCVICGNKYKTNKYSKVKTCCNECKYVLKKLNKKKGQ